MSELIRRNLLPNIPQLLMDAGNAALAQYSLAFGKLPQESPIMQQYLKNAENAFRLFVGRFPQSTHFPEAKFLIGEIQYQKRDYARAYQSMFEAYKISKGLDVLPEYLAHFALVAHYQKQVDLVHPESSGNARRFAEFIRSSTNPTLRLEFARLLDQAGAAAQATSQYAAVAEMIDPTPTAAQKFEARHRITEFALEDLKKGKVNSKIPYDDYLEPVAALDDLTSQTYDIKQIGQLVKQKVETLLAQKKPLDAIRVVLGNPAGQVPNDVAASLRPIVWDVLKEAIPYCRAQDNPLYALEVYDAFAPYLEDHPQKNRILLSCAELLMDSDYRADAQRLMDRVTSTTATTMTAEDESELSLLRREVELNPADKEAFKRDAPALTSAGNPIPIRARVFRQLAAIYSDEGNHSKAAQIHLEAANLGEELPWEERQNLYLLAGKEYEEEDSLLEANRTYLQAMKAFEQEAINIAKGESYLGESLFRMGKNYQQLADYDEAARAFSQYLQLYSQSPNAAPALYLLAQSYEKRNRLADARDAYELLVKQASDQPFWANAAQKSLNQLKWEESHADLLKGASK